MKMVKRRIQISIPEHLIPGLITPFSHNPASDEELNLFLVSLCELCGVEWKDLEREIPRAPSLHRMVTILSGMLPRFSSTRAISVAGRPRKNADKQSLFFGLPISDAGARWLVANVDRIRREQQKRGSRISPAKACERLQNDKANCPTEFSDAEPTTMAKHYWAARKRMTL
jgi:hypothetical protein